MTAVSTPAIPHWAALVLAIVVAAVAIAGLIFAAHWQAECDRAGGWVLYPRGVSALCIKDGQIVRHLP